MASETEMIRQQMEGTRKDLAEKLELLEAQVADKVDQVSTTVADTVEAVSETVDNVKETVEETVDAVEHTFDLNWHAQHHPWALMGGAALLGFLGGSLLLRPRRREREVRWSPPPPPPAPPPPTKTHESSGGFLGRIGEEVGELKKYGIGMAMGVMREVVANALPTVVAPAVSEAVNNLTVKLGGHPLGESHPDHTTSNPCHEGNNPQQCGAGI
jgi:ElaB/YqjD/DUF883 family membrane-anchored ribosome-binding protein